MEYIVFRDVCKYYKMGELTTAAVDHMSFSVEKGEFCVVVGPSGAGKTTLLNILGGMDNCDEGEIYLDDKKISGYNKKQLTDYRRYDGGFVFQFYNLIQNLTALENVELASEICKIPLDTASTLAQVGLSERMFNFPAQLSGGEQQRVAIARALAKNPKILLCLRSTGTVIKTKINIIKGTSMEFNKIMQLNLTDTELNSYQNSEMIENIKEFVAKQQLYNAAIKEKRTKIEILDEEFQVRFDHNPIHHIEYRLKSPKSIIDKLKIRKLEISTTSIWNNSTDVAGVRVICNYIDDINRIADFLIKQDDTTVLKKRDYIANPKENGYRSLHLIIAVPIFLSDKTVKVPVEIQIRTIAMDFWASLEHQLKYKSHDEISDELRSRLKNCAESITNLDMEMQSIYKELKVDTHK